MTLINHKAFGGVKQKTIVGLVFVRRFVLDRAGERGELAGQAGAERGRAHHHHGADDGCDQAIFQRGHGALVGLQLDPGFQKFDHVFSFQYTASGTPPADGWFRLRSGCQKQVGDV